MELLDSALKMVDHGYAVLPLLPHSKVPNPRLAPKGLNDASRRVSIIRAWWGECPDGNVGISLPKGLLVWDMDSPDCRDSLDSMGYELPDTATMLTGRGEQLYYQDPSGTVDSTANGLLEHVDLRTAPSYVIGEQSVHPNGSIYEWRRDIGEGVSAAPDWMVDLWKNRKTHKPGGRLNLENLYGEEPVKQGARNDTIYRLACRWWRKGLTPNEIHVIAQSFNQQKIRPPLPSSEVTKTVNSALTREGGPPADHIAAVPVGELTGRSYTKKPQLIRGILPSGFTVMHSEAKVGKSLVAAHMAKAVARGEPFIARHEVVSGPVLYLDLENDRDESAERWRMILGEDRPDIDVITEEAKRDIPKLENGALDWLTNMVDRKPYRLVVVDVIGILMHGGERGGNAYIDEYDRLGLIKEWASKHRVSVLGLTHPSKSDKGGPSGSMAWQGVPSCLLKLSHKKEAGKDVINMIVRPRSMPKLNIDLVVDYHGNDIRQAVREVTW